MRFQSWRIPSLFAVLMLTLPLAQAQTALYHLHKEPSGINGNFDQLKTTGPDASATVLTKALANQAAGDYVIKEFETQTGVPNTGGVIPGGSTLTFSLYMRKTASPSGVTVKPEARVKLNSATGTTLCSVTGPNALTTTVTQMNLSCTTPNGTDIRILATDRFYLWTGVNISTKSSSTYGGELDIEGTLNGKFDSQFVVPIPGAAALSTTSLSFGNQIVNTTSAAKVVTLNNNQSVALTISGIATSGDYAQTNNCGSSVAAHGTCTINVTFTPTVSGTRTGTLTVTDSAGNSPQTASLTGTGIIAAAVTPTSLSFGNQIVSTTSAAKSVTLANNQTVALSISSVATNGDYAQTNNCGTSLAAGTSCTINVTFKPTAAGTRTGTLTVTDNANNSPQTASLTGTGVLAATLSPSTVTFANQIVGTTSAAQAVTLKNNQSTTLSISTISTGGDFAQTNNCGTSLAVGASCTINLSFKPTAAGTRSGTLTVTDNANNSPQTASLSGIGVGPVSLSPTSVDAGSQALNASVYVKTVTLTNSQAVVLNISSIAVSGDYLIGSQCHATLAANSSCNIDISFQPTALGTRTGTLTVTDDASNSPQTVSLTGVGVTPVGLSPAIFTFTNQGVASTSPGQVLTILNNNRAATLHISRINVNGDFGSQPGNCFTGIASGTSCTVNMTFTPSAVGPRSGILTIVDDATNSPQTVPLSGNGIPNITSLSPSSGPIGTMVTVTGAGFGSPQGTSTITFGNLPATPFSWSDTAIKVAVPDSAQTGNVVVTNQLSSNGAPLTVIPPPSIATLSSSSGAPGDSITINGLNFGTTQGASIVRFNGLPANTPTWNDGAITATVPANVTSGPVTVTVSNQSSNGVPFSAITAGALSGIITRSSDGSVVTGASIQLLQSGVVKFSTTTASNGTYLLSGVNAGTYDIQVSAAGLGTALQNAINVPANRTTAFSISLSLAGSIIGTVTQNDTTTPVAGASVQVLVGSATGTSTVTDSSGLFTIAGLNAGTYTVQASAAGYVTRSQIGIIVNAGANTTQNLALQSQGNAAINYVYDQLGRLVGVTDLAGDTATYKYDAVGNILSITRGSSAQTSIISFLPSTGSVGTTVTINGTGFSTTLSQNSIQFSNNVSAVVTSATPTQLVTSVPTGVVTGPITVSTPGGTATTTNSFAVNSSSSAPTITGFIPPSGVAGTQLTITGTNFDSNAANESLTFNVTPGPTGSSANTQIAAMWPSMANSGPITVTTTQGKAVSSQDFYVPFSSAVSGPHPASDIVFTGRMRIGDTLPVSIPTPGKIGLVLFDGVAGQKVNVSFTGGTFPDCLMYWIEPRSRSWVTFIDCSGASGSLTETLSTSGTYSLGFETSSSGTLQVNVQDATDQTGTITVDGPPVQITTSAPNQGVRLSFAGSQSQHLQLSMSAGTFSGCSVSVTSPTGSTLASGNCAGNSGLLDIAVVPLTGPYTISIQPQNVGGTLTLQLKSVASDVTGTLALGTPLTVTTGASGQNARLTFAGSRNQHVSLSFTNASFNFGFYTATVWAPNGIVLASGSFGGGNSTLAINRLTITGTYILSIAPQNSGSVTVTLNDASDVSTSIALGQTVNIATVPDQSARLTFTGNVNQHVSISLNNGTYGTCLFTLFKPDGTVFSTLVDLNCAVSSYSWDIPLLPLTGTYTILIAPQGAGGSASVTLNDASDVTSAISLGQTVTASTTLPYQNIRLTFTGNLNQHISVSVNNSTYSAFDCQLSVLDTNGNAIVGPTSCITVDVPLLPTAGTYAVFIQPHSQASGSIAVTLNDASDVTGALVPGTAATFNLLVPYQTARITFQGSAFDRAFIKVNPVTINPNAQTMLLNPDGTVLSTVFPNPASGGFFNFTDQTNRLPQTGTYTIKLQGFQSTGSAAFTLYDPVPADVTTNVSLGSPASVTTTTPGQKAVLTFNSSASQPVTVHVSNNNIGSITVKMVDNFNNIITQMTSAATSFDLPSANVGVLSYTIFITPASFEAGSTTVTITSP